MNIYDVLFVTKLRKEIYVYKKKRKFAAQIKKFVSHRGTRCDSEESHEKFQILKAD